MNTKCYTQTIVVKNKEKIKFSVESLKTYFVNKCSPIVFKDSKFRNCISLKYNNKSVKIYTNLTLKITGSSENFIEETKELLNYLKIKGTNFTIECVMCNWIVKISYQKINLVSTMNILNEQNDIIAYFLRGVPLLIKYKKQSTKTIYHLNTNSEIYEEKILQVSVSLFSTGNCIISGPTEVICHEFLNILTNLIILE